MANSFFTIIQIFYNRFEKSINSVCSAVATPHAPLPGDVRESLACTLCSQTTASLLQEYQGQSKHLSSKPFYHLISASFFLSPRMSRGSAERSFSWMIEYRGWLQAQLPRPPQADFTGNSTNICTIEPTDRPREISVQSNPTFENPTHCKML